MNYYVAESHDKEHRGKNTSNVIELCLNQQLLGIVPGILQIQQEFGHLEARVFLLLKFEHVEVGLESGI